MKNFDDYEEIIQVILGMIVAACPEMPKKYYLSGTTPISITHLKHAVSLDLDLHTQEALKPTSAEARALSKHFKKRLEWFETDHEFGIFRGTIDTGEKSADGKKIQIEIDLMSNFEETPSSQLQENNKLSKIPIVSLEKYLSSKIACLEERDEPKDIYHLYSLTKLPGWDTKVERALRSVDPLTIKKHQNQFQKEWPAIKKTVRSLPDLAPLNEEDLFQWVKNLGKTKTNPRPLPETGLELE